MSAPDHIADVRTSSRTILRITCETSGPARVNLQELGNTGIDNQVTPRGRGITVPVDRLDAVLAGLQAARLKHRGEGFL